MIPDKLYVEISGNKDSSVYWIGRTSSVPQSDDSVEYIRKDALLEWAKIVKQQSEELKESGQGDVFYGAQIALIDEVIAKIKSL